MQLRDLTRDPHYLSIDLDYWTHQDITEAKESLTELLEARSEEVPVTAVMNHHQMLWNVQRTKARRLINLDYHSDLVAPEHICNLHCGNWVSFVNWRRVGEYIWVRPCADSSLGNCQAYYKNVWTAGHDWWRVESAQIRADQMNLKRLLRNCLGIGLCMSPAYVSSSWRKPFLEIVNDYKIPYRDGDALELQSVARLPSGVRGVPQADPICVL